MLILFAYYSPHNPCAHIYEINKDKAVFYWSPNLLMLEIRGQFQMVKLHQFKLV